jgi:hypothetical protein
LYLTLKRFQEPGEADFAGVALAADPDGEAEAADPERVTGA